MLNMSGFKLDRDTPTPLYYQIEQHLMENITRGDIAVGECLPAETELTDLYNVSRITVRQAIANLVNHGVVERHKGKGTYVKGPKIPDTSLQTLETFRETMTKKGHAMQTKVLDFRIVGAIAAVNQALSLDPSEPLIYLRRYRSVDGDPYLYFETYLPAKMFEGLLNEDLEKNSLYDLLERKFDCRVDRVSRRVEAKNASKEDAQILNVSRNRAIFLVTFTGYCKQTMPVEYSVVRYRGDAIEFTIELQR